MATLLDKLCIEIGNIRAEISAYLKQFDGCDKLIQLRKSNQQNVVDTESLSKVIAYGGFVHYSRITVTKARVHT